MSKFTIKPISKRGTIFLTGSYSATDGSTKYLLWGAKKVVTNPTEDQLKDVFRRSLMDGEPFSFVYDEADSKTSLVLEFFKNHPQVEVTGYVNPNYRGAPQFHMEIKDESTRRDKALMAKRTQAMLIIFRLTTTELFDVAFYLGVDPREMTPDDVLIELIGADLNGRAIQMADDVIKYSKTQTGERTARIYAQKAINHNIIVAEDGMYKVAGRNVGRNLDDVVSMLLSDPELFDGFIKPECDKNLTAFQTSLDRFAPVEIPDELKALIPATVAAAEKRAAKGMISAPKE